MIEIFACRDLIANMILFARGMKPELLPEGFRAALAGAEQRRMQDELSCHLLEPATGKRNS